MPEPLAITAENQIGPIKKHGQGVQSCPRDSGLEHLDVTLIEHPDQRRCTGKEHQHSGSVEQQIIPQGCPHHLNQAAAVFFARQHAR